ncbi:MAG: MFS transporter [Anaerolineae bacterium]
MKPYTRLTVIAFLLFMARGMTGPLSSLYWRSLGASYLAIGLLGTVTSITAIVASYVWGRASDRLGQRRGFLLVGLGGLALCFGLLSAVSGTAVLFPLYAAVAVAQAAYDTASLALMGDWLEVEGRRRDGSGQGDRVRPSRSGRRMGIYRGLGSLGFGVTAFVSGSIADALSLRVPFALAACFFVLAFLLAVGVREPPPEPSPATGAPSSAPSPAAEARRLPLAPLLIAALLWSLVTGAVYAVWANYMVEAIGYTSAQMTRLWALASLSEFPLMIVAGWLSDRVGRLPMLAVGFLAWAGVFTGYLIVPTMPWIVVVQLLRGFAYSAHTATAMIYAAEVRSRGERGRISGLYGTAGALGSIVGSSLGGAVTEYVGFRALIGAGAGVIFAGALYLSGASVQVHRRRHKRAVPSRPY